MKHMLDGLTTEKKGKDKATTSMNLQDVLHAAEPHAEKNGRMRILDRLLTADQTRAFRQDRAIKEIKQKGLLRTLLRIGKRTEFSIPKADIRTIHQEIDDKVKKKQYTIEQVAALVQKAETLSPQVRDVLEKRDLDHCVYAMSDNRLKELGVSTPSDAGKAMRASDPFRIASVPFASDSRYTVCVDVHDILAQAQVFDRTYPQHMSLTGYYPISKPRLPVSAGLMEIADQDKLFSVQDIERFRQWNNSYNTLRDVLKDRRFSQMEVDIMTELLGAKINKEELDNLKSAVSGNQDDDNGIVDESRDSGIMQTFYTWLKKQWNDPQNLIALVFQLDLVRKVICMAAGCVIVNLYTRRSSMYFPPEMAQYIQGWEMQLFWISMEYVQPFLKKAGSFIADLLLRSTAYLRDMFVDIPWIHKPLAMVHDFCRWIIVSMHNFADDQVNVAVVSLAARCFVSIQYPQWAGLFGANDIVGAGRGIVGLASKLIPTDLPRASDVNTSEWSDPMSLLRISESFKRMVCPVIPHDPSRARCERVFDYFSKLFSVVSIPLLVHTVMLDMYSAYQVVNLMKNKSSGEVSAIDVADLESLDLSSKMLLQGTRSCMGVYIKEMSSTLLQNIAHDKEGAALKSAKDDKAKILGPAKRPTKMKDIEPDQPLGKPKRTQYFTPKPMYGAFVQAHVETCAVDEDPVRVSFGVNDVDGVSQVQVMFGPANVNREESMVDVVTAAAADGNSVRTFVAEHIATQSELTADTLHAVTSQLNKTTPAWSQTFLPTCTIHDMAVAQSSTLLDKGELIVPMAEADVALHTFAAGAFVTLGNASTPLNATITSSPTYTQVLTDLQKVYDLDDALVKQISAQNTSHSEAAVCSVAASTAGKLADMFHIVNTKQTQQTMLTDLAKQSSTSQAVSNTFFRNETVPVHMKQQDELVTVDLAQRSFALERNRTPQDAASAVTFSVAQTIRTSASTITTMPGALVQHLNHSLPQLASLKQQVVEQVARDDAENNTSASLNGVAILANITIAQEQFQQLSDAATVLDAMKQPQSKRPVVTLLGTSPSVAGQNLERIGETLIQHSESIKAASDDAGLGKDTSAFKTLPILSQVAQQSFGKEIFRTSTAPPSEQVSLKDNSRDEKRIQREEQFGTVLAQSRKESILKQFDQNRQERVQRQMEEKRVHSLKEKETRVAATRVAEATAEREAKEVQAFMDIHKRNKEDAQKREYTKRVLSSVVHPETSNRIHETVIDSLIQDVAGSDLESKTRILQIVSDVASHEPYKPNQLVSTDAILAKQDKLDALLTVLPDGKIKEDIQSLTHSRTIDALRASVIDTVVSKAQLPVIPENTKMEIVQSFNHAPAEEKDKFAKATPSYVWSTLIKVAQSGFSGLQASNLSQVLAWMSGMMPSDVQNEIGAAQQAISTIELIDAKYKGGQSIQSLVGRPMALLASHLKDLRTNSRDNDAKQFAESASIALRAKIETWKVSANAGTKRELGKLERILD